MILELPWPPSVNHYWRRNGNRYFVAEVGKAYRANVEAIVVSEGVQTLNGRIGVLISAHPPDRRTRDLDNVLKSLLDAMEHAGCYHDDGQIDLLTIERKAVVQGGRVVVSIHQV